MGTPLERYFAQGRWFDPEEAVGLAGRGRASRSRALGLDLRCQRQDGATMVDFPDPLTGEECDGALAEADRRRRVAEKWASAAESRSRHEADLRSGHGTSWLGSGPSAATRVLESSLPFAWHGRESAMGRASALDEPGLAPSTFTPDRTVADPTEDHDCVRVSLGAFSRLRRILRTTGHSRGFRVDGSKSGRHGWHQRWRCQFGTLSRGRSSGGPHDTSFPVRERSPWHPSSTIP